MVNQFKNFIENETKFIRKEVLGEFGRGNPAPLMRYATTGTALGFVAKSAREQFSDFTQQLITGKVTPREPQSIPEEIIDTVASVGALSIYYDILQSVIYKGENWPLQLVAGLSDVAALSANTVKAVEPAFNSETSKMLNLRPLARQVAGAVPVIGPDLRRGLETEKQTKRRFTRALVEADKLGRDLEDIFKLAEEAGFTKRELKTSLKQSKTRRKNQEKKVKKAISDAIDDGDILKAVSEIFGLGET